MKKKLLKKVKKTKKNQKHKNKKTRKKQNIKKNKNLKNRLKHVFALVMNNFYLIQKREQFCIFFTNTKYIQSECVLIKKTKKICSKNMRVPKIPIF